MALLVLKWTLKPGTRLNLARNERKLGVWHTFWSIISSRTFGSIADVLSLVGISLAVYSLKDGNRIRRDVNDLVDVSDKIKKSLSTTYLGAFSDYMPEITDLVTNAKRSLTVVSTAPALGSHSAPQHWEELSHALISSQQQRGLSISLVINTPERAHANYKLRFHEALSDWGSWLKSGKTSARSSNEERLKQMCQRRRIECTMKDGNWFLKTLETVQLQSLTHTYYNATPYVADDPLMVLAWIADENKEAIFALSNSQGLPPAFRTRDSDIIAALTDMSNRLIAGAECLDRDDKVVAAMTMFGGNGMTQSGGETL